MLKRSLLFSASILFAVNCFALKLSSESIENNQMIKAKFVCLQQHGGNESPQLSWKDIPKDTQSLLLVSRDPDAAPHGYVHWLVYIDNSKIKELKLNQRPTEKDDFVFGKNDAQANEYFGPCPPKGTGVHRYRFILYALNTRLDKSLAKTLSLPDFQKQIQGHVIERAEIIGLYTNKD